MSIHKIEINVYTDGRRADPVRKCVLVIDEDDDAIYLEDCGGNRLDKSSNVSLASFFHGEVIDTNDDDSEYHKNEDCSHDDCKTEDDLTELASEYENRYFILKRKLDAKIADISSLATDIGDLLEDGLSD